MLPWIVLFPLSYYSAFCLLLQCLFLIASLNQVVHRKRKLRCGSAVEESRKPSWLLCQYQNALCHKYNPKTGTLGSTFTWMGLSTLLSWQEWMQSQWSFQTGVIFCICISELSFSTHPTAFLFWHLLVLRFKTRS